MGSFIPILSHRAQRLIMHLCVFFLRSPCDFVTAFADGMSMCSINLNQSKLRPICLPLDGSGWQRLEKKKETVVKMSENSAVEM